LRWADLDGRGTLPAQALADALPVWQGVHVLSCDWRGEAAGGIAPAAVDALASGHDLVVLDLPRAEPAWAGYCDSVLIVTTCAGRGDARGDRCGQRCAPGAGDATGTRDGRRSRAGSHPRGQPARGTTPRSRHPHPETGPGLMTAVEPIGSVRRRLLHRAGEADGASSGTSVPAREIA